MTLGALAKQASETYRHDAESSATMMLAVSLTATNYVAQYASGAPIADSTGPFTVFAPTRVPEVVLGATAVPSVIYTIVGTDLAGAAQTEHITRAGAGTSKSTVPFATITSFSSNIDPGGTTDLKAIDTWVDPPARAIIVGVAGAIAMQLAEDSAVVTSPSIPAGVQALAIKRINVSGTAATDLALLF